MNRLWWALKLAGWLLLVLIVLLLIVLPVTMSILINNSGHLPGVSNRFLLIVENIQRNVMQVFAGLWFFAVGSCFASFLNVVAYRIPRGGSILGSSHCPTCNVRLSFRDNIPIVGWLRNQGECRNCHAPIAVRYLIVEIVLGLIFLLFALATLASGGFTLPIRELGKATGFERVLFDPQWDLIQIVSFHLALILFLFTFTLIALQHKKMPVSIFVTGLVLGIAMPLVWPAMQLVNWQFPLNKDWPAVRFASQQFITMGAGILVGLVVGAIVTQVSDRDQAVFGFGLVGLFLGWQSAIVVLVLFLICLIIQRLGTRLLSRPGVIFGGANANLLMSTMVHLLTWRWMNLV